MRVEAVKMLGMWANPPRRDRITGLTQDLGTRPESIAVEALRAHLGGIFAGPDAVRREATTVAAKLGIKEVAPVLFAIAADDKQPTATRIEAVRAWHRSRMRVWKRRRSLLSLPASRCCAPKAAGSWRRPNPARRCRCWPRC